jgi:HEAT repeat protein
VRFAALKGLLYFGKPVAPADTVKESTALEAVFADKNEAIGIWARLCYMRINTVSADHLAAIAKHLSSTKSDVRAEACKAFAIIGPEAKSQVPALIICLDDKVAVVVIWACAAVAQMKEAGLPALPKLTILSTSHVDAGVRAAAKEAIQRLEDEAKKVADTKEKKDEK